MKRLLFTLAMCLVSTVIFPTNVGGNFFTNQNWTLSGSPYTVTSNVNIADVATLTIDPGVTVNFAGNASGCRIKLTAADKNGRIGAEEVQNVSSSNATFQVDTSRLLSPFVRLTAELNGTDGKIKAVATLDRILLPSKRTDFNRFIHYTWGRGEDSFPMEYGLIGQHWHKTGNIGNCSNGTISIPYFWTTRNCLNIKTQRKLQRLAFNYICLYLTGK